MKYQGYNYIDHFVRKVTPVSAEWDFDVNKSTWKITQESPHFPKIVEDATDGKVSNCRLKGGRHGCQLKLVNTVEDPDGKIHTREWWVNTWRDAESITPDKVIPEPATADKK